MTVKGIEEFRPKANRNSLSDREGLLNGQTFIQIATTPHVWQYRGISKSVRGGSAKCRNVKITVSSWIVWIIYATAIASGDWLCSNSVSPNSSDPSRDGCSSTD